MVIRQNVMRKTGKAWKMEASEWGGDLCYIHGFAISEFYFVESQLL